VPETRPTLRLLARPFRLLCRLPLPAVGGAPRELALVASPAAPYLRRLTVYRRPARQPLEFDPPRAA